MSSSENEDDKKKSLTDEDIETERKGLGGPKGEKGEGDDQGEDEDDDLAAGNDSRTNQDLQNNPNNADYRSPGGPAQPAPED